MTARSLSLSLLAALIAFPVGATGVEADWHFIGQGGGAVHAEADWAISRFFAIGGAGWFPVATGGAPNMLDAQALFTIPVDSLLGMGLVVAPWAGYRGTLNGGSFSQGPGFGLRLDVRNRDFPLSFKAEAGAYPFMSSGAPNWFDYEGALRYSILDDVFVQAGFRGHVASGGGPNLMGPFVSLRYGT